MISYIHACIFILCINFCLGLQCTYPVQIQLPSYELTLTNIEVELNNLKRTDGVICEVHVEFDCTTQMLSYQTNQQIRQQQKRS